MAVTDHTARQANLCHFHLLETGDTASNLSDWVAGFLGVNSAGDWVRDNEDGTYSWRIADGEGFDPSPAPVGWYLVIQMRSLTEGLDGPFRMGPDQFAVLYFDIDADL